MDTLLQIFAMHALANISMRMVTNGVFRKLVIKEINKFYNNNYYKIYWATQLNLHLPTKARWSDGNK